MFLSKTCRFALPFASTEPSFGIFWIHIECSFVKIQRICGLSLLIAFNAFSNTIKVMQSSERVKLQT